VGIGALGGLKRRGGGVFYLSQLDAIDTVGSAFPGCACYSHSVDEPGVAEFLNLPESPRLTLELLAFLAAVIDEQRAPSRQKGEMGSFFPKK
jgi:hypothetical protein